MIDAAIKALEQMLSPPFRTVLLKSAGLAVLFLVALGIGLDWLLVWLTGAGGQWFETTFGPAAHWPVVVARLGTRDRARAWPGGRRHLPDAGGDLAGRRILLRRNRRVWWSARITRPIRRASRCRCDAPPSKRSRHRLLAILIYLCAVPFLLFAGLGAVVFFFATAYVLGRQYFELAAMRFHPVAEAKALRRANAGTVFVAGLLIAAFVSIPIINLATPLFGMAFMVHMHKRLRGTKCAGHGGRLICVLDRLFRPAAQIVDQTFLAQRPPRQAGVAAVQDQPVVGVALVLVGHHLLEVHLDLERRLAGRQPGPVADAEDVRVDRDRRLAERDIEHDICGLAPDAGQRFERLARAAEPRRRARR